MDNIDKKYIAEIAEFTPILTKFIKKECCKVSPFAQVIVFTLSLRSLIDLVLRENPDLQGTKDDPSINAAALILFQGKFKGGKYPEVTTDMILKFRESLRRDASKEIGGQ